MHQDLRTTEGYRMEGGYQLPILLLAGPVPATREGTDEVLSPIGDGDDPRPPADPEVGR
ncbi:hypothetical protein [Streptomyces sp. ICN441]|uniref:hypothetical protein n=1 Tax=Streptomyces sp. ICN441 TaxID=2558286 RepID=UPI00141A84A8|nr:hypothetical protein [Streptomyces sp. ICN441]